MTAYYNENDPKAAAWLRELIRNGYIADGVVDERSIEDITPSDVKGFTQCHFFAGIGGWSYALRLAGWSDARPVWTGSCPCQPFSTAGKGGGTTDERHLWPAWFHLISQCKPSTIFGEQVAAAIKHGWLDLVQTDLEGIGYAFGSQVMGAHSLGAPHIRQRLWFVGDSNEKRRGAWARQNSVRTDGEQIGGTAHTTSSARKLEHPNLSDEHERPSSGEQQIREPCNSDGSMVYTKSEQKGLPGCTWFDGRPVDWIDCQDGKQRPVEPSTFPLAHGVPARMGRLRGYGNAIVPQVAAAFIKATQPLTTHSAAC